MDAEERFLVALAKAAHDSLIEEGDVYLMSGGIEAIAKEQGATEAIARHVLRRLDDQGLLMTDDGHFFRGGVALALLYEEQVERAEFWRQNAFRREVLHLAAEAYERDDDELTYMEAGERFSDRPYPEAVAAARSLEHWGLAKLRLAMARTSGSASPRPATTSPATRPHCGVSYPHQLPMMRQRIWRSLRTCSPS
jgi:hypothetical protein